MKRLREVWLDAVVKTEKTFQMDVTTLSGLRTQQASSVVGTTGDRLSIDFRFGISAFGSTDFPSQARTKISVRSRRFQFRLREQDTGIPHILNNMTFWWLPRGKRFNV